jgi:hypothetical protein
MKITLMGQNNLDVTVCESSQQLVQDSLFRLHVTNVSTSRPPTKSGANQPFSRPTQKSPSLPVVLTTAAPTSYPAEEIRTLSPSFVLSLSTSHHVIKEESTSSPLIMPSTLLLRQMHQPDPHPTTMMMVLL